MSPKKNTTNTNTPPAQGTHNDGLSRRELLWRGSAMTLGVMFGGAENLHAEELATDFAPVSQTAAPPVKVAVIGCGDQGRTLLTSLSYVDGAVVTHICDNYPPAHKRALEIHPKATAVEDYRQILSDASVQGVFIATPPHLHLSLIHI